MSSSCVNDDKNSNKAGCVMPLDMWREVLVRLPRECLMGIRAVCRGFRAVIDDPGFVRSHTTKNWSSWSSVVIRNYYDDNASDAATPSSSEESAAGAGSSCCYSVDLEGLQQQQGHHAIAATPLDLDFLSANNSPAARFPWPVATCNGLVLTQNRNLFTMWNPKTRERLELPPTAAGGLYAPAFGLGYDHATDDYKAVVVLRDLQTHVYSLRSDAWRRISADCPLPPFDGPGVFAGGLLNWKSGGSKIVALDLGTEKYSLLQMPTRMPPVKKPKCKWLNVLGGCLVVCDTAFYGYLDVWVLKKKKLKDSSSSSSSSWVKLFSLDVDDAAAVDWHGFLRPVAFLTKNKDDERLQKVFLQDGYKRFFLFDLLETKSLKCVGIHDEQQRKGGVIWDAHQMFVGTMFPLHANCGTRTADTTNKKRKLITMSCRGSDTTNYEKTKKKKKRRTTTDTTNKKRKITSCCCCTDTSTNEKKTNTKRRKTSCCTKAAAAELVFCVRDANRKNYGVCSEPDDGRNDIDMGLLNQQVMRETEGFDFPFPGVNRGTRVPAKYKDKLVRFAHLALDQYNQINKMASVFDRVVYASYDPSAYIKTYHITFRIKNNAENYGPDIFHAEVCDRGVRQGVSVKLVRPRRS